RRAAAWSPYDEAILRRLLLLLGSLGDRAGVIREYEAFRERLLTDLEVAPSPETESVVEEIRSREGAEAVPAAAAPGSSALPAVPPSPP
ncbi:MAG: BTAD domain-containing putative transcriptional regulator, partial [Candidatus Methylomirabilia bacterium]